MTAEHDYYKERDGQNTNMQGIIEGKALNPESISFSTEDKVREYFKDTPVMAKIAYCESKFKQFDKEGNVLKGELTPEDIGVMQINEYFHGDTVNALGINIYVLDGNLEYAKWLYEKEGTAPWSASKYCWDSNELAMI